MHTCVHACSIHKHIQLYMYTHAYMCFACFVCLCVCGICVCGVLVCIHACPFCTYDEKYGQKDTVRLVRLIHFCISLPDTVVWQVSFKTSAMNRWLPQVDTQRPSESICLGSNFTGNLRKDALGTHEKNWQRRVYH